MKRVIYIAFVLVGLFAVSCSKESIHPISNENEAIPEWKSASAPELDNGAPNGQGSITDPNNDDDGGKRKKQ